MSEAGVEAQVQSVDLCWAVSKQSASCTHRVKCRELETCRLAFIRSTANGLIRQLWRVGAKTLCECDGFGKAITIRKVGGKR